MKNLKLKGFTLVEILIVIVIVASLMAIVLRNISGSQEKSRNTGRIQILSKISTDVAAVVANANEYPGAGLGNVLAAADMPKDARNLKGKGDCFKNGSVESAFGYTPLKDSEGFALLSRLEPQGKNVQATIGVEGDGDACAIFAGKNYKEAKDYIDEKKCGKGTNNCETLTPYYVIVGQ